jgi:hypothetical protein
LPAPASSIKIPGSLLFLIVMNIIPQNIITVAAGILMRETKFFLK